MASQDHEIPPRRGFPEANRLVPATRGELPPRARRPAQKPSRHGRRAGASPDHHRLMRPPSPPAHPARRASPTPGNTSLELVRCQPTPPLPCLFREEETGEGRFYGKESCASLKSSPLCAALVCRVTTCPVTIRRPMESGIRFSSHKHKGPSASKRCERSNRTPEVL